MTAREFGVGFCSIPGTGVPWGIRTLALLLRRQLLYPAELLAHICLQPVVGAGDGNRTHAASLEGWNSTIELHSHNPHVVNIGIISQKD